MKKYSLCLILICFVNLISISFALDPVICQKGCPDGFHVNHDCSCSEGRVCIALACDNPDHIREYRGCGCIPRDELLPYDPIVCPNICPPGSKINAQCNCDDIFPGFPDPDPIPTWPDDKCLINKCDRRFQFVQSKCICKPWRGATCRKGCPKGMRIYAYPNIRVNCKCEYPPKCKIKSCKGSAQLVDCKCRKKTKPKKCPIRKCKRMFEVHKSKCICRPELKKTCRKRCPPGKMVKPGTCKCKRRPKCPIRFCIKGYRLNRKKCKCVKRKSPSIDDFDF
jgi:hypothetical protein